jgi:hypothetical protein
MDTTFYFDIRAFLSVSETQDFHVRDSGVWFLDRTGRPKSHHQLLHYSNNNAYVFEQI